MQRISQTKIKICGLRRTEDVWFANAARPDYVGFVINCPESKRSVTVEQLKTLKRELVDITAIGVFVDEKAETVAEILNSGVIDGAQLHGGESAEYITRLKTLTDKPVIKAFVVGENFDCAAVNSSPADLVLIDGGRGGGKAFDYGALEGIARPFFLAGGLDADSAAEAARTIRPYGVDISSGTETDGIKDYEKMKRAVAAVRREVAYE